MTVVFRAQPTPKAASAPFIARLALTDFRGYQSLTLTAAPGITVLVGENGAGKTNLLEALSYLAPGRGLRGAGVAEVLRRDARPGAQWAVSARALTGGGWTEIGTGPVAMPAGERRHVRIDGKPIRGHAALGRVLAMVWLTPAMDGLFRDGASGRRRFLDRLVHGHDAGHAERLAAYEHGIRERSRLLAEGRNDVAWLGTLEASIARHGTAIAASRLDAVARLDAQLAHGFGPFPAARVAVRGAVEDWLGAMPAVAAEERFQAVLAAARPRDAETGGAGEGPHRSDLVVHHAGTGAAAAQCSTGEQKALLVAILLADARGKASGPFGLPILLLDEIAAHLDAVRRAALFDELHALGAQVWLSGTDRGSFAALTGRARFLEVRAADLSEVSAADFREVPAADLREVGR